VKKYELKKKLLRSLKTGPKTLDELQAEIGKVTKKEISACLDILTLNKWVERYGGMYRLRYVLDAPLKEPKINQDWNYEQLQLAQGAQGLPVSFQNKYIDWIPQLCQGDRGTCCGFAGRYAAWLLQLNLIDPKPEIKDVQAAEFDVPVKVWGQCTMLCDTLHKYAPSAQGLYFRSRIKENITAPSGSFIRGIVRTWKDEGYNFESDWVTSKTSRCAPERYPITDDAKLLELSKDHKLDGYATITSWEGLKDAIYNYGCAIIAINLYENMEANNKTGPLPEPKGDPIGSHALCAIGYDEKYVYFLHSWRQGWSKVSGISKRYYNYACGTAYAPIDAQDVIVATEIYGVIKARSNVNCNFMFGTDTYKNIKEAKTSWLLDKICDIHVEPVEKFKYKEKEYSVGVTVTKEKPEVTLDFQFTEKDDIQTRIRKFLEELLKKIKSILDKR